MLDSVEIMNIEISLIPGGDATDDMAHGFPKFLQRLVFSTKDTKKENTIFKSSVWWNHSEFSLLLDRYPDLFTWQMFWVKVELKLRTRVFI